MGKIDVPQAVIIAQAHLSPEGFAHSLKVAEYALELKAATGHKVKRDSLFIVAILHDVLEDAPEEQREALRLSFQEGLPDGCYDALMGLTHDKASMDYDTYCESIKRFAKRDENGELAYLVKLADMKDHLSRVETLTDKLKEKYLSGLRFLL